MQGVVSMPSSSRPAFCSSSCSSGAVRGGFYRPVSACWKQVSDSVSGKAYYWNVKTNETRWELPRAGGDPPQAGAEMSYEKLTEELLSADKERFGDAANKHRPRCFELEYFEYLTRRISDSDEPSLKLELERLRARLSNPLLKNPPPYEL